MKKTFKNSSFCNISNTALFEIHQRFKGHFLNELRISFNIKFSQKNIFKNKSKRKRNFMIYHFLVESKPHGRIDLLITASGNIYQTKKEVFQQYTFFFYKNIEIGESHAMFLTCSYFLGFQKPLFFHLLRKG